MTKTRVGWVCLLLGVMSCATTAMRAPTPPTPNGNNIGPAPNAGVSLNGAAWVLDHLRQQTAATDASAEKHAELAKVGEDARALRLQAGKLPAREYAERWIALARRYSGATAAARPSYGENDDKTLLPLFEALPDPAGWPALVEALRKHAGAHGTPTEIGFALMASALGHDTAAHEQLIESLKHRPSSSPQLAAALQRYVYAIRAARGEAEPTDPKEVEALVARIEGHLNTKPIKGAAPLQVRLRREFVSMLGESRARDILARLAISENTQLVAGYAFQHSGIRSLEFT